MTHTEITVVDSGYFDPNDSFTARPIVGSQGLPVSGYDEGAPFYHIAPSSEWWGDDYEWNWGHSPNRGSNARTKTQGYLDLEGSDGCGDPDVCGSAFLGSVVQISGRKSSNMSSPDFHEFDTVVVSITGQDSERLGATRLYFTPIGRAIGPIDDGVTTGSNTWYMDMYKNILGEKKENNEDVETKGYEAPFGINYFFPAPTGDLNEDWQSSSRFGDVRWYEQSGLIPTYPSNHPDESRDPQRSPNPKERVYAYQGSKDAAGAANELETGSPKSSVDGSSDQAFSNAADSTNTNYVLGMEDAFMHYYEDTYQYVYKPGGKTGPTKTLVNKFESLDFNDRFHHRESKSEIKDKSEKIYGVQVSADPSYKHSAYVVKSTPEPEEQEDDNG